MHNRSKARRAFTLIDLTAVLAVIGVVAVFFAQAMVPVRHGAMRRVSEQNLSNIGQFSAVYARENKGRLPAYSWQGGQLVQVAGRPSPIRPQDDIDAHGHQNTDMLRRLTGRVDNPDVGGIRGTGKILNWTARIPDRRFSHLILADSWGLPANAPIWASPADVNLLRWQADPIDFAAVPYFAGNPDPSVYDDDLNWEKPAMKQRWAYGSSYQWVTAAWSRDTFPTYAPVSSTPHLFTFTGPGSAALGGRRQPEVMSPSAKVFVFEEFDWMPYDDGSGQLVSDGLWCTYDNARSAKLMFDGSVLDRPAGEANSSWTPQNPSIDPWTQRYVPLDAFPIVQGDPSDQIDQRFRWTRGGLRGIDYVPGADPVPGPLNRAFDEDDLGG